MANALRQVEVMGTATATSLSNEVASRLLQLPHVVEVQVRRESDVCYVWTAVDEFSAEVREAIHLAEQAIVADFRPAKFSFLIVPEANHAGFGSIETFKNAAA
jgi:hypothetical protein